MVGSSRHSGQFVGTYTSSVMRNGSFSLINRELCKEYQSNRQIICAK